MSNNPLVPHVWFIGDVHGKCDQYASIVEKAEGNYTVQIGDMGFSYGFFKHYGIDPEYHVFFGGNHDNYDKIKVCPNFLGYWGYCTPPGWQKDGFFYVGGAQSMDKHLRTEGKDWWKDEEIDMFSAHNALVLYEKEKPKIMVTHDCPNVARDEMLRRGKGMGYRKLETRTGQLLQAMINLHEPDLWIFGHWHHSVTFTLLGIKTKFVCLGELEWLEV